AVRPLVRVALRHRPVTTPPEPPTTNTRRLIARYKRWFFNTKGTQIQYLCALCVLLCWGTRYPPAPNMAMHRACPCGKLSQWCCNGRETQTRNLDVHGRTPRAGAVVDAFRLLSAKRRTSARCFAEHCGARRPRNVCQGHDFASFGELTWRFL